MHEMGIAAEILRIAQAEAARAGAARIQAMDLRIGLWSGVEPDSLCFALEALGIGTPAEGAQVRIERVSPRFHCRSCGAEFEGKDHLDACPRCESVDAALIAGEEMALAAIEVEET
jgi:hydrogenase nickel incorporation protein HypA/HybF